MPRRVETIVFGGGCFWCTEAVFGLLKGVISVESGYAGGDSSGPTYESVSSGKTGHAEVLKINYDSEQISFHNLLTVFFASHNPTTLNQQGADVGTQYRSIILYTTIGQRDESLRYIDELKSGGTRIVTEVKQLDEFFPAEDSHQHYYENHQDGSYSEIVIVPKLKKVQKEFRELIRDGLK